MQLCTADMMSVTCRGSIMLVVCRGFQLANSSTDFCL